MTDTEAALLRAIAANPDEDTPRLVFADYLDELGEPSQVARAEFIRLSIRAARGPADYPERDVAARIDRLLYLWDTVWQKEMPPGCKTLAYHRRGFAFRGAITASELDDTDDPRLHLLEYVELTPDVSVQRLAVVMKGPVFARVKAMVIRGDRLLGAAGARAFAEGEYPQLERLVLARQAIGNIGLRALCDAWWNFPRLRELDLADNNITDDGIAALIRSSLIVKLQRVDLANNPISLGMRDRVRPGRREW